jgi:hypothetical protein
MGFLDSVKKKVSGALNDAMLERDAQKFYEREHSRIESQAYAKEAERTAAQKGKLRAQAELRGFKAELKQKGKAARFNVPNTGSLMGMWGGSGNYAPRSPFEIPKRR